MQDKTSRFVGMLLAAVLSGAAEPAVLLAQQPATQQDSQSSTPGTTSPSPSPSAVPAAPSEQQQTEEQRQQQEDKASQDLLNGTRENGTQLPESPDTTRAREEAAQKAAQQQNPPGKVTGTAAAPAGTVSGTVASRPAGVAIAPAKQRQVRSFLIKLGVVAGAGIALGTVYALSRGSSSTPPGAH
jgi:hypothetical protein